MPPPINSQYDSFAFALVLTQVNKPATHQSGAVPPGYGQPKGRNKAVTTVQRPDESWPYWGSPHPGHTVAGGQPLIATGNDGCLQMATGFAENIVRAGTAFQQLVDASVCNGHSVALSTGWADCHLHRFFYTLTDHTPCDCRHCRTY